MYTNDAICYAAGTISRHREIRDDALQNRVTMPKYASRVSAGEVAEKKKGLVGLILRGDSSPLL